MSYCKENGKDKVMFLTEDDLKGDSAVELSPDDKDEAEASAGLILPNGDINWNCPCLGGLGVGPCAYQFREAFTCFHTKKDDEPMSMECMEKFDKMQQCLSQYPNLYPVSKEDDEDKPPTLEEIEGLNEESIEDTKSTSVTKTKGKR